MRQRDSANGDGFAYDLTQQIIGFQRDGASVNLSAGIVTGGTANAMEFDGTGNRTKLNGTSSSYNNMNQPTDAGITYDTNGNLKTWNGWTYLYDAQNRLRSAVNTGASPQLGASTNIMVQFYYDGLNRQVARSMTNVVLPPPPYPPPLIREAPTRASGPTFDAVFSVWDGDWAILEEYTTGNVLIESYVQGYHGLVKTVQTNIYYYQDELGSTSHIANSSGALLEYYKYDLYGKPTFFSSTSQPLNSSTYGVKDLFTGQRWIPELGLYDDRNRFMSPDLGRFLQPDPIGFKGDSSNLYRYCGNDWANKTDPMGLFGDQQADRANMQREQHDQHMDASQQVAAMEKRAEVNVDAHHVENMRESRREARQAGLAAEVRRQGFESMAKFDKAAQSVTSIQGGNSKQQEAMRAAVSNVFHNSYRGIQAVRIIQGFGKVLTVNITNDNYSNAKTFGFEMNIDPHYGDEAYHPGQSYKVDTTAGSIPYTPTRQVAHELGHAVFGFGADRMSEEMTVQAIENPIMYDLGEPLRLHY